MGKNKVRLLSIMVLAICLAVVTGCGARSDSSSAGAKKAVVLKAADVQPDDYPTTLGLKYMAKLLDERTQGRIKMDVYANAQLGDEKATIEMTQMGTIAINRVSASPLIGFVPKMGVFSLPYLFTDADQQWKVLDGKIGKAMLQELGNSNLVGLAYYDSGARSFYTKSRPIKTPEDLNGLKIRVQPSQVFVDTIAALGGSATPMGLTEVYSGLQTGIVDGAENNPPSLWTMKHYEVCKYYSLDEHSMVPEVVMMSKKVWSSLAPEDQELVAQVAAESVAYEKKLWAELTEKSLQDLKDHNVVITKVDKEPFRKRVQGVYDKYPEYKDLVAQIQAVK